MTAHTASNVLAICTPRSVKPAKNLLQVLVEESTFRSRNGNGTNRASPALVAPCRWWAQASSPSKMRFSVATATAAYRTQPLIYTPSLPICTHTYTCTCLFHTAVPSNENVTSQVAPMQILLLRSHQQSAPTHTIV